MVARLKYVSAFRDRHGVTRWRFRRGAFSAYLPSPAEPSFAAAYAAALEGSTYAAPVIPPATVRGCVLAYRAAPEFRGLAAHTKRTYDHFLDAMVARFGERSVITLRPEHLRAIVRVHQDKPDKANRALSVWRIVLDHAVERGVVEDNPARKVRNLKRNTKGFAPWSDEDVAQFEAAHGPGSRARLALRLMLWTGQRRSDAIRMGWQSVRDGWISVRQAKTGAAVDIPIAPALAEELARVPRDRMLFLVTASGRGFSPAGFGNWFGGACREAGLKERTAHGLRKACAGRLAEVGCSPSQIQAITGHRTLSEVTRYTRGADQRRLAAEAMAKLSNRLAEG